MKLQKGLRELKGKTKQQKIFGYDVETGNNNKDFVVASIYSDEYKKVYFTKEQFKKDLVSNQIFRNSFIVATNLMFDFFATFEIDEALKSFHLVERSSSLIFAVAYISYNKNDNKIYHKKDIEEDINNYYKITFIDSINHLKASVKNLGKIIGLEKLKAPEFLGHKPKNDKEMQELITYNLRDSEVTYKFMKFLQNNYNTLGANLKVTISSTALDLYRRKYHKGFWPQEKRDNINMCYKAYYGGRTEAFKRGYFSIENYKKIKVYDVNSLYPYCLKKFKYPLVNKSYYKIKVSSEDVLSFEGIAYFELKTIEYHNIPLIPTKQHKLIFPLGTIKGYYDFNTIRKALKNGYEIISIGEGIIYEHTIKPFEEYINSLWDLRQELKKRKDSSQLVAKILMNSFYGKLGFNYMDKETIVHAKNLQQKDFINNTVISYGGTDYFRLITNENHKIPSYVFPIMPLYVTSYARGLMFDNFKKVGSERVFYTDTDCIFTDKRLHESNELGELGLENTFEKLIIVKPKFYSGLTCDNDVVKVKGLHGKINSFNDFKKLIESKDFRVKCQHFRKFRGALNKGYVNEVYDMVKVMDFEDDKRKWSKNVFDLSIQDSKPLVI